MGDLAKKLRIPEGQLASKVETLQGDSKKLKKLQKDMKKSKNPQ